jgi:DNA-binding XRE family transcriptional regulator
MMSKAKQANSTATEATEFVKRVPFEPEPGQIGMNREQMIEAGWIKEGEGTVTGALFALIDLMKTLKERRASLGLSLTDVSERSGLTRQAISKLENGHAINPTLDTLFRYSQAMGAGLSFEVEEIESEE